MSDILRPGWADTFTQFYSYGPTPLGLHIVCGRLGTTPNAETICYAIFAGNGGTVVLNMSGLSVLFRARAQS